MVCSATAVGESSRRDEKMCDFVFFLFEKEEKSRHGRRAKVMKEERESFKLRDRCLSLCMR